MKNLYIYIKLTTNVFEYTKNAMTKFSIITPKMEGILSHNVTWPWIHCKVIVVMPLIKSSIIQSIQKFIKYLIL